ncbi:MAG: hypothetical protein BWY34_00015 [Parcubacteria group bacterium ADurb.Bin247]|nr:MAG: hypothetical protein BWY34_00015 [Parcubacteria group bacterium ADurb.Bin247]
MIKKSYLLLILTFLFFGSFLGVIDGYTKDNPEKEISSAYVEGEVLVKYKDSEINLQNASGRVTAFSVFQSKSLELEENLRDSNISLLKIKDNKSVEEKTREIESNSSNESTNGPIIVAIIDTGIRLRRQAP